MKCPHCGHEIHVNPPPVVRTYYRRPRPVGVAFLLLAALLLCGCQTPTRLTGVYGIGGSIELPPPPVAPGSVRLEMDAGDGTGYTVTIWRDAQGPNIRQETVSPRPVAATQPSKP